MFIGGKHEPDEVPTLDGDEERPAQGRSGWKKSAVRMAGDMVENPSEDEGYPVLLMKQSNHMGDSLAESLNADPNDTLGPCEDEAHPVQDKGGQKLHIAGGKSSTTTRQKHQVQDKGDSKMWLERAKQMADTLKSGQISLSKVCVYMIERHAASSDEAKTLQTTRAISDGLSMYGFGGLVDAVAEELTAQCEELGEIAQAKISEQMNAAVGELTDSVGDDSEIVTVLSSCLRPFIVQSKAVFERKSARNPLAYKPKAGKAILRKIKYKAWLHYPMHCLHRCPAALQSVYLIIMFSLQMSRLVLWHCFRQDEENNTVELNSPQQQFALWEEEGIVQIEAFMLGALMMCPFIVLVVGRFAIGNCEQQIAGSMVHQLRKHYRPLDGKSPSKDATRDAPSMECAPTGELHMVSPPAGRHETSHGEVDEDLQDQSNEPTCIKVMWRTMHRRSKAVLLTELFFCFSILTLVPANFAYKVAVMGHPGKFILFGILLMIDYWSTLPPLASFLDQILTVVELLQLNIRAYKELADVLCFQVHLLHQEALETAMATEKGKSRDDIHAMVAFHPLTLALYEQMQKREEYLTSLAKVVVKGELAQSFESVAGFWAIFLGCYFCSFLFMTLKVMYGDDTGLVLKAASSLVMVCLITLVLAWPGFKMAAQTQEWMRLTQSFGTSSRTVVSEILSSQKDQFFLFNKHNELKHLLTWKVLGLEITYATIGKTVASYLTAVFIAVVLPMVHQFINQQKANLLNVSL
mmetsp:Transcript_117817/g.305853  ORF Transcript_117817/g.305853 Transcript_117817/m.305853 type:complete len:749 (+) Transcript_117817:90-2336(+)